MVEGQGGSVKVFFKPKKTGGGGGSTRIPLPFFTVFNMGDSPKKGPKMQNKP